jgi:hypothetical protein
MQQLTKDKDMNKNAYNIRGRVLYGILNKAAIRKLFLFA